MTTPDERTRSLLQTGAFLKELSSDPCVAIAVREEALRLLRHYPTVSTVSLLARLEARHGSNILTPNFEPAWLEGYSFGGHTS